MKNLVMFYITVLCCSIYTSCKKNDNSGKQSPPPDPQSQIIYKGVLLGSSGYYSVQIGSIKSSAQIVLNDKTYNLESNTPVDMEEAISDYTLTKDDVSITLNVDKDRIYPEISITAAGHPDIITTIYEHKDETPVENYTGWSKSENDTSFYEAGYNLSINGNQFTIIEKTTATNQGSFFASTIMGTLSRSAGKITFSFTIDGQNNTIHATEQGNAISYLENWDGGYMQFELTKVND